MNNNDRPLFPPLAASPYAPRNGTERTIAMRDHGAIFESAFYHDVSLLAQRIQQANCRRGCLVEQDPYHLLVGLIALLASQATPILPPHSAPVFLEQLQDDFDYLISKDTTLSGNHLPPCSSHQEWPAITRDTPLHGTVVLYTSGSTGTAKRVERQWAQLTAEIQVLHHTWPECAGAPDTFSMVPPYHLFGLTFAVLWPFLTGRPLHTPIYPFWEELLRQPLGRAVIISSPAQLACTEALPPIPENEKPHRLFVAGAPLLPHAVGHCQQLLGVLPDEIFGSTETGAVATRRWQSSNRVPAWHPLPGLRVRADAEQSLQLLSPYLSTQWITMDDQIHLLEDGSFTLLGRRDRVIKVNGHRVSLQEVEHTLLQLDELQQAKPVALQGKHGVVLAVVAVPSAEGWAFIQQNGSFRFTRHIRQRLQRSLPPAAHPKRWRFVHHLPHNALGKITTHELNQLFFEHADDCDR
ncbi:MAG: acyl-CoA synthetase [Magnetococcales bacterium]|nr:acyl-CoA synthetase [Magnetococcales bacterium]MBF0114076.1 acyl-CoA synthetase [Magnetococcales bacterium]